MIRPLAGLVVFTAGLAYGACAPAGKLCTPPGQQGNNPACCAPLSCPSAGPSKNHCTSDPGPIALTTTTVVGPHYTTSTVPPIGPSLPPPGNPLRFGPGDVGVRFRSSQDMLWNPQTGLPATQYEANIRVATLHWVMLPEVLRLLRDTPRCGVGSGLGGQVKDMTGKFLILYSMRPLRDGGVYQFHGNYLWDLPQGLLRRAVACVPPSSIPPGLAPLFASGPAPPKHQTRASKDHALDGLLDARRQQAVLSQSQCQLLAASHARHEAHAAALLAHDPNASALAPAVVASQLAFEASARSLDEATLFALVFTGAIDPQHPQERVDYYTRQTSAAHHRWVDAFHCGEGRPPDLVSIWAESLAHARAHFLRAITLPGLKLRHPCLTVDVHYCPVDDN